ncbi:hypothetical protein MMC25_004828 [Agyrium rufum]|nr:hypothetical protein [Agyrium rufum]
MIPTATFFTRRPPKPKAPRSLSLSLPTPRKASTSTNGDSSRKNSLISANLQLQATFFSLLPAEIRIEIYEHLVLLDELESHKPLQLHYTSHPKPNKIEKKERFSYLRVCKRFTAEVLPLVYATKSFELHCKDDLRKDVKRLRSALSLSTISANVKKTLVSRSKSKEEVLEEIPYLHNASLLRRVSVTNYVAHNFILSWSQLEEVLYPFSSLEHIEIALQFSYASIPTMDTGTRVLCPMRAIIVIVVHPGILGEMSNHSSDQRTHEEQDVQARAQFASAVADVAPHLDFILKPGRQSTWVELMTSQVIDILRGVNGEQLQFTTGKRKISAETIQILPMTHHMGRASS